MFNGDETMELNQVAAKRTKRLMAYLKREYGKNKDFTITLQAKTASIATVKLTYHRFLDTSQTAEFDQMMDELKGVCEGHGEALSVKDGDSYFGAPFASLVIKHGATINCDSLMSHIEIDLSYPMSSK